jgi:hypothetical protein
MDRFSNSRRKPPAGTLLPSQGSGSRPAFQRRSDTASGEDLSSTVAGALRQSGQPLDASVRHEAEGRLGFDFSHVRIHTGESAEASAQALHAHAYTLGRHIVFGSGGYAPDTEAGRHRLYHELSHVMQQRPGSPMPEGPLQIGSPDSAHERQAHRMARAASPAEAHSLLSGPGPLQPAVIARDPKPGAPEPAPEEKPSPTSPISPDIAERQARNAYPNNPRAAELQKKMILGTITKPELSELRGIASFPDNPRAAALYAKQDAGTITPAEQEELRGHFSRLAARQRTVDRGPASLDGQPRENPRAAALRAKQAAGPLSREEQAELQGLNGYPDNPRAAALSAKRTLGTITKQESAELQAFDTYPYNRRAAALYTRMLLGEQLTWDEKGVIYDENYYQSMGEFLIRLERRAREGRLREGEGSVYEHLRHDPKVLSRKADILRSGRFTSSAIDD